MIKKKPFGKIKCKIIKEGHNPVCILTVKNKKTILGIELFAGKYILKNITKEEISDKDIELLKSLSYLKLIPKIYMIDKKYIIMDYFNGMTLSKYLHNYTLSKNLYLTIKKLIRKWHKLGYAHGDLALLFANKNNKLVGADNLLIGRNNSIILIDPTIGKLTDADNNKLSQFDLKKKYDLEFLKELEFYVDNSLSDVLKLSKGDI